MTIFTFSLEQEQEFQLFLDSLAEKRSTMTAAIAWDWLEEQGVYDHRWGAYRSESIIYLYGFLYHCVVGYTQVRQFYTVPELIQYGERFRYESSFNWHLATTAEYPLEGFFYYDYDLVWEPENNEWVDICPLGEHYSPDDFDDEFGASPLGIDLEVDVIWDDERKVYDWEDVYASDAWEFLMQELDSIPVIEELMPANFFNDGYINDEQAFSYLREDFIADMLALRSRTDFFSELDIDRWIQGAADRYKQFMDEDLSEAMMYSDSSTRYIMPEDPNAMFDYLQDHKATLIEDFKERTGYSIFEPFNPESNYLDDLSNQTYLDWD